MTYYKNVILKGIKNKRFCFAILIVLLSMGFSIIGLFEEGLEHLFNNDYVNIFLLGYNGDRTLFTILAPLIATIPFAAQHIENRKSGTTKYLIARMGKKKYFNSIFFSNVCLSALVFLSGMIIFLLFSFILFHKDINLEMYYGMTRISAYEMVARTSPIIYVLVIIVHCSVVAVAYASLGLSLSFFWKNKFVAWISPFIIATIGSLFAIFIGFTKIEPMAIFDVSRVQNMSAIFVISYSLLVIMASYVFSYNKFKKDIRTDEEI